MLPLPFPAATISLPYGAVDGKYYTLSSPHQGTDFSSRSQGVTAGTAIRASGPGRVVRSGVGPSGVSPSIDRPNNLAGNSIDVDYGDFIARYMHRPWDSPSPAVGSVTVEGTLLGVIGDTGLVSAAHLHMETWDKRTGRRVNPANYFDYSRVVDASAAARSNSKPFDPEEDDMTAQQYEDLMWEIACNRPIKMYALVNDKGEGGWIWVGPSGRTWVVPSGDYAALVAAEKLSQPRPIRAIQQNELAFITKQLLGALAPDSKAETQIEHILTLDDATVSKLAQTIGQLPVTVTDTQLQTIAETAAAAAQAGGAAAAAAAIAKLEFVVKASA